MNEKLISRQTDACARAGVLPAFLEAGDRIGIARDFDPEQQPIHGLRHSLHGNMCGWYLWAGEEFSTDEDHFRVICYQHLVDEGWFWVDYLALPAGWRFLVAAGYEDLWFDETLLDGRGTS